MTFKSDERIFETSITTGTGTYTLAGAQSGYQAASVLGANNYGPFFVTDPSGTSWEALIGQVLASPARLVRTAVMASSNGGAAVDWGAGTRYIRCGWPAWLSLPRVTTKSVAGNANVDLTQSEQRCQVLVLTGALTGNIEVHPDATPWLWWVYNNTTGTYTVTFKPSGASGKVVPQGTRAVLACDGTDVVGLTAATKAEQEAGTTQAAFVTPALQQSHPSAAKFWITCNESGTIIASYNVTSITDVGVGQVTVTIGTDFSSAHEAVSVSVIDGTDTVVAQLVVHAAGSITAQCVTVGGVALNDPNYWFFIGFGAQ